MEQIESVIIRGVGNTPLFDYSIGDNSYSPGTPRVPLRTANHLTFLHVLLCWM
jgi:hypothetical protein